MLIFPGESDGYSVVGWHGDDGEAGSRNVVLHTKTRLETWEQYIQNKPRVDGNRNLIEEKVRSLWLGNKKSIRVRKTIPRTIWIYKVGDLCSLHDGRISYSGWEQPVWHLRLPSTAEYSRVLAPVSSKATMNTDLQVRIASAVRRIATALIRPRGSV